jgi:hypothetical protein
LEFWLSAARASDPALMLPLLAAESGHIVLAKPINCIIALSTAVHDG